MVHVLVNEKPKPRRTERRPRFGRLGVERLGDRIVPTVEAGNPLPGSTDFNTAANWSGPMGGAGAVPGVLDEAHFDKSWSSANCTMSADDTVGAIVISSNYGGTVDLGSRTLTLAGTGGFSGWLDGGKITNGTLNITGSTFYQNGGTIGSAYINVGGSGSSSITTYSLASGNINATSGTALDFNVNAWGQFLVSGSTTIGNNINVAGNGKADFNACVLTATIANGAVITVDAGGTLDLNAKVMARASSSTYIENSGLVEKTDATNVTALQFGIQNVASTAVLSLQTGELQVENSSPGHLNDAIYQSAGQTKLYDGTTLELWSNYTQDGGRLSAMGVSSGTSTSTLNTLPGAAVYINAGSVVLGDGTTNHRTTLDAHNADFTFGATASLNFGINPGTPDNDLLETSTTTINAGAKAVLDTSNLGVGVVPNRLWTFLTGDAAPNNNITGAFTPNVGPTYTIAKDAANNNYKLST